MGTIIKGICKNCGYETNDLYFGGGFMNFTSCCNYPVLDKETKEITMANIINREEVIEHNPNLIFIDDNTLFDKKIRNRKIYHEWGQFRIYHEGYLCPKCNQFSLGFEELGCWD